MQRTFPFVAFESKAEKWLRWRPKQILFIDFLSFNENFFCVWLSDMFILCSVNCRKTFLFWLQRDLDPSPPLPPPSEPPHIPSTLKNFVSPRSHAMSSIHLLSKVFAFAVQVFINAIMTLQYSKSTIDVYSFCLKMV